MAVRSVHQIDIDDSAFQRFAQMFARYQQMLRDTPEAWRKVGDATDTVIDKTVSGLDDVETATEGVNKAASGMAVSFRQTFVNVNNYAGTIRRIGTEQSGLSRIVSGQARLWRDMGRYTHTFAQNIGEATRSLLRWGSLAGLISGLVGAGGLFGISRLATNAASGRREAAGFGNTIGQQRAFETNFGRLVDPQQFLGGVSNAMTDPAKSLPLVTAGIKYEGRSTADVSADLIKFIERLVDQTPEQFLGSTLQNYGLSDLISVERARQIKHTSPEERAQIERQYRQDATQLNIPDAQAKAWTDLATQLSRAGTAIETLFTNKLVALAEPLSHLSDSVVKAVDTFLNTAPLKKWIDDLAGGIQWLGDYMAKPEFKTDIESFVEGIDKFGKAVIGVAQDLYDAEQRVKAFFTGGISLEKGGVNGPITDDNPNAPGSPAFYKAHPEIKPPNWNPFSGWFKNDRPLPWGGQHNDLLGHEESFKRFEDSAGLQSGLLKAVALTESSGNRFAVGPATADGSHAVGPFQFMPATAARYGVQDLTDVDQSAGGAARYLGDLLKEFGGDRDKALAGYNWGEKNVEADIARYGTDWKNHLPAETADYLRKVGSRLDEARLANDAAVRGADPAAPKQVINGRPSVTTVRIENATGGNAVVSASQLSS